MDFIVKGYNKELNKSHYKTLNLLKQYSCKIIGICHLKIETIAKSLGINERTVRRHIKHLKENGFITVIPTSRPKKGGDGANAYAINSPLMREEVKKKQNVSAQLSDRKDNQNDTQYLDTPMFDRVLLKKETIFSLKLSNSFKVTKSGVSDAQQRIENIKNFRERPEGVPESIYKLNTAYFSDGQISRLYDSVLEKLVPFKFNKDYEEMIAIESFKSLVLQLKKYYQNQRSKIKNIFCYIKGTAQKICDKYSEVHPLVSTESNFNTLPKENSTALQSRELTPKWLHEEKNEIYVPELEKQTFKNELSSIIEKKYKDELPEDLYNDLQITWLQEEWEWSNDKLEAMLNDKEALLLEQIQFAEDRMLLKKLLMTI